MTRLFALLALVFCLQSPVLATDSEKMHRYLFQEFGPNGVPKEWVDDSAWADIDKRFQADRISEEQQVAKITLEAVRRGHLQILGPTVPLQSESVYTVRVRLRATPAQPVEVGLREKNPPCKVWAGRKNVEATSEWTTQTLSFEAGASLPEQRLILGFSKPGTVWVDSIQINEQTKQEFTAQAAKEMKAGNLLPNGDFRLGTYGWATTATVNRETQYPLDTAKQYSLNPPKFEVRDHVGVLELTPWRSTLISDFFPVKMGAPFEYVAKVRRAHGTGPVGLKLFSPSWAKAPGKMVEVGQDWQEIRLKGETPSDMQLRCEVMAQGDQQPGVLEIESVRLEQRSLDAAQGPVPVFGVVADREMTVYEASETPSLRIIAAGLSAKSPQGVEWTLVDSNDKVERKGSWKVGNGELAFKVEQLPVGWHQLRWAAPWAQNQSEGRLNLGVVPKVGRNAGDASPWGIHVEGCDLGVRKMQLLGIHWLRAQNPLWTKWTAVQPERDVWLFPDEYVDKFINAGLGIMGDFDRTPRWAARNPSNYRAETDALDCKADLPNDWPAWEEYVRQMVHRYKGKITYWEVWNEPDIVFLNPPAGMTNAEAYLQLLEHTTPIIKKENPEAKVVASPAYVLKKRGSPEGYQPDFVERLIEAGGLKYIDIFAIHHYLGYGERLFDKPEKYQEKLGTIRTAMKAAGKSPVLWDSEWGIINFTLSTRNIDLPSNNGMTGEQAAGESVVWSVGQLAAGLEKIFWYDGQDNFYYHFHVTKNLFEYRQPAPAFVAFALLTKTLDGLTFASERKEGTARILAFSDGAQTVEVAYTPPGTHAQLLPKKGQVALDCLGRHVQASTKGEIEVTSIPVYLLSSARMDAVLAR